MLNRRHIRVAEQIFGKFPKIGRGPLDDFGSRRNRV
jgi:hypothetical protein